MGVISVSVDWLYEYRDSWAMTNPFSKITRNSTIIYKVIFILPEINNLCQILNRSIDPHVKLESRTYERNQMRLRSSDAPRFSVTFKLEYSNGFADREARVRWHPSKNLSGAVLWFETIRKSPQSCLEATEFSVNKTQWNLKSLRRSKWLHEWLRSLYTGILRDECSGKRNQYRSEKGRIRQRTSRKHTSERFLDISKVAVPNQSLPHSSLRGSRHHHHARTFLVAFSFTTSFQVNIRLSSSYVLEFDRYCWIWTRRIGYHLLCPYASKFRILVALLSNSSKYVFS